MESKFFGRSKTGDRIPRWVPQLNMAETWPRLCVPVSYLH